SSLHDALPILERTIQGVLYSVQFENDVKWAIIFDIIHMFQKDGSTVHRLFENYFDPDEREIIKHLNEQTNENDFYKWQQIIQEVRENLNEDPGSETAQRLARQWMNKVDVMFSGNKKLEVKMWKAIKEHSEEMVFYPMDTDVVSLWIVQLQSCINVKVIKNRMAMMRVEIKMYDTERTQQYRGKTKNIGRKYVKLAVLFGLLLCWKIIYLISQP